MEQAQKHRVKLFFGLILLASLVMLMGQTMEVWAKEGKASQGSHKRLAHPTITQFAIYLLPG